MKPHPLPLVLGALALLNGCAVQESLRVTSTVLIKVPDSKIHRPTEYGGWHFRHVLEAPAAERSQWYVAWNNERPLRTGLFTPYWRQLFMRAPEIADATKGALKFYPILIEPNRTFTRFAPKQGDEMEEKMTGPMMRGTSVPLVYQAKPSPVWPVVRTSEEGWPDSQTKEKGGLTIDPPGAKVIDPVWHLRDRHSQLATARDRVGRPAAGRAVRIGHLDNGYDNRHAGLPEGLMTEKINPKIGSLSNAVGRLEYEQYLSRRDKTVGPRLGPESLHPPHPPGSGEARGSHGLGTMGLLAGSHVTLPAEPGRIAGYSGYLGGAPHAEVVSVRVAPWVISLNTAELAYALDYASRRQKCDVISMSHGGAPTQAWADAVNAAYERGTAMFAAESDFFSLVGNPFRPAGIILPASPVYPASFRRVVGVTGVASDGGSYGRNRYSRLLLHPHKLLSWAFRGSYGADGTSAVLYRPMRKADPEQVAQQGELRAHPIAASAPNVPWLATRRVDKKELADALDLDGGGTSASTPQVAAAAALWLQKNQHQIPREVWEGKREGWRKAEAVYYALLHSADRGKHGRAHFYLGAGQLKANDALDISYREAITAQAGQDLRFAKSPLDYFDGGRSVATFLGFGTLRHVPEEKRAQLWQVTPPGEQREMALTRLYYNLGLLREWHGGDLPQKEDQERYWKRAQRRAARATGPQNQPVPQPHPHPH